VTSESTEAPRAAAELTASRRSRSVLTASILMALAAIGYALIAILAVLDSWDVLEAVLLICGAALAALASVTVWRWPRVCVVLGSLALIVGLFLSFLLPWVLTYLLVPGLPLGFAMVLVLRRRGHVQSCRASLAAFFGALVAALILFPWGFGMGLAEAEGADISLLPFFCLQCAALLGFAAAGLMLRWPRVGGSVALLAVVVGTCAAATQSGVDTAFAWGSWCVAACPLLGSGLVALWPREDEPVSQ